MPCVRERIGDGAKNVTQWVRGYFGEEEMTILVLDKSKMSPPPRRLSLASLLWCIDEKAKMALWMHETSRDVKDLLVFMESRNGLRPDHPILLPNDWEGKLYLTALHEESVAGKWFWIILDLDKS